MSYQSAVEDMSLPLSSSHSHESYKSTAPSLNPTAPPLTPDTLPSTTSSDENVKDHHHLFHSDYAVVVEKEYSLSQSRSRNDDPTMENNVTLWTPIPLDGGDHIQDPDDERNTFEEDRSSSRGRKISFRKTIRSVITGGIGGYSKSAALALSNQGNSRQMTVEEDHVSEPISNKGDTTTPQLYSTPKATRPTRRVLLFPPLFANASIVERPHHEVATPNSISSNKADKNSHGGKISQGEASFTSLEQRQIKENIDQDSTRVIRQQHLGDVNLSSVSADFPQTVPINEDQEHLGESSLTSPQESDHSIPPPPPPLSPLPIARRVGKNRPIDIDTNETWSQFKTTELPALPQEYMIGDDPMTRYPIHLDYNGYLASDNSTISSGSDEILSRTSPRRKLHKSKDSTAASFATSLQTPKLSNLSSRVDSNNNNPTNDYPSVVVYAGVDLKSTQKGEPNEKSSWQKPVCVVCNMKCSLLLVLVITVGSSIAVACGALMLGLKINRSVSSPIQQAFDFPSFAPSSSPIKDNVVPLFTPTRTPSISPSVAYIRKSTLQPTPTLKPTQAPSFVPTLPPFASATFSQIGPSLFGFNITDHNGYSVSLSKDGNMVAIGTRRFSDYRIWNGAVVVYRLETDLYKGSVWLPMGQVLYGRKDKDEFGFSVSLSDDGMTLAVGEPGYNSFTGCVRVFLYKEISKTWEQIGSDINGSSTSEVFGTSLSLSGDGVTLVVGAPFYGTFKTGRVRVFRYIVSQNDWTQIGLELDGTSEFDNFGRDVSISGDGTTVACGAPNDSNGGYVRIFRWNSSAIRWELIGSDIISSAIPSSTITRYNFGWSVAVSYDGMRVVIGAPGISDGSGEASVFAFNTVSSTWLKLGGDLPCDVVSRQNFGWAVSISQDGCRVAVGAPGINRVMVYEWIGNIWTPSLPVYGETDKEQFGWEVALAQSGSTLAIGSPRQRDNFQPGLARVYILNR